MTRSVRAITDIQGYSCVAGLVPAHDRSGAGRLGDGLG
jgi:hypothetical protein